jgi:L-lactate dehydrogenase (cytochrome)
MINMGNEEVLRKEDIAPHSDSNDCWIIVNGKVWDVTQYLVNHPGGTDGKIQVAHNKNSFS